MLKGLKKYSSIISETSDERNPHDSNGIWVYLKEEYETCEGLQTIHEETIKECISKLKTCKKIQG